MRQIGAGDHDRALGVPVDDRANSPQKFLASRVVLGTAARALAFADAAEDGDDAHLSPADQVLDEHRLELERMLALVVEHVRERVERGTRGDGVDGADVRLDGPEGRVERLATEGERLAHGRVRGAEQHERVDVTREPRPKQAICMPVADLAAPRVDVRRDEPAHGAVLFLRPGDRDAFLFEVGA